MNLVARIAAMGLIVVGIAWVAVVTGVVVTRFDPTAAGLWTTVWFSVPGVVLLGLGWSGVRRPR